MPMSPAFFFIALSVCLLTRAAKAHPCRWTRPRLATASGLLLWWLAWVWFSRTAPVAVAFFIALTLLMVMLALQPLFRALWGRAVHGIG